MSNASPYKMVFSPFEYAQMLNIEQEFARKRNRIKYRNPDEYKRKQAQKAARKKQR